MGISNKSLVDEKEDKGGGCDRLDKNDFDDFDPVKTEDGRWVNRTTGRGIGLVYPYPEKEEDFLPGTPERVKSWIRSNFF